MRGFKIDTKWLNVDYRGKNCSPFPKHVINNMIYCEYFKGELASEHNPKYLLECLENLKSKNAQLINGKCVEELIIMLNLYGIF